jgi:hypothetical protein
MRRHTPLLILAPLFISAPALAFEPIAYQDVQGLVGKTVYAASNSALDRDNVWIYAGEPLKLVKAEQWNGQGEGEQYNFVVVQNAEGKSGEVQLKTLSKKPLRYNLRKPGAAKKLLVQIFDDAYPLPSEMHRIRSKYDYDMSSFVVKDGKELVNPDYHLVEAMDDYYRFASNLVHNLIYSSNRSEEDLLREGQTKWLAFAKDDALLSWYADGIKDKSLKSKLAHAKDALGRLEHVAHHGFDIARLEREREEKDWLRGMEGVPAGKVKKIEAQKISGIQKEIKEKESKIQAAFKDAAKMKRAL